jgi:serine/threonine-protein kinase RsbW
MNMKTQRRADEDKSSETEEWLLETESRLDKLAPIGDFVAAAASEAGLDEQATFDVQLATDEACCNIIEHAYKGVEGGEIEICCTREGNDFVVSLKDRGRPFNPDKVPAPDLQGDLNGRRIGGLGLHFIRRLMDEVFFTFDEAEGNELVMIKRGVARRVEAARERAEAKAKAAEERTSAKVEAARQKAEKKVDATLRKAKAKAQASRERAKKRSEKDG